MKPYTLRIILSVFIIFIFQECSSLEKVLSGGRSEFLFSPKYKPTQTYWIDPTKDSEIKGEEGTKILVRKNSILGPDGSPFTGEARIELAEYYSDADILLSGLSTASGERMIETKGMIRIEAFSSEGKKGSLDKSKPMEITFASESESDYKIFYGEKSSEGRIDWSNGAPTAFRSNLSVQPSFKNAQTTVLDVKGSRKAAPKNAIPAPASDEAPRVIEFPEQTVGPMPLQFQVIAFGWINCDRFLEFNPLVPLLLNVSAAEAGDKENPQYYYLIFHDIKSVMPAYIDLEKKTLYFPNLPPGKKATVLGLKKSGETKWMYWSKSVTVGKEDPLSPDWTIYGAKELESKVKLLQF